MFERWSWRSTTIALLLSWACAPAGDLDAHARGSAPASVERSGASGGNAALPQDPAPSVGSPGEIAPALPGIGAGPDPSASGPAASGEASGAVNPTPRVADAGGPASEPSPQGTETPSPPLAEPPAVVPAPALPDDLIDAPVAGEIEFSDEAEWEVDGVFEPTFEIRTPTASYWVVKPLGTIVSIEDRQPDPAQWIAFSSGFRPLRGVPSFPAPPAARVTTVRDQDSQTPTHLRLTSISGDGLWQWVWDFYVTHVTFTVNRAPTPFGFGYQGVPGGSLGAEDRLVSSDGQSQGARSSFNADLAGPVEWAYLADTTLGRSLFALQHHDDALAERYVVRDNDTSLLLFGNGLIDVLPMRFSLGLIPSVEHAQVTERVEFVARSIAAVLP